MSQKDNNNEPSKTQVVLTEGTMVPPYRIVEKIGGGGMGEVYLADDIRLKRKVAIKFLPAHLIANEDVKSRFYREAQAVAKLNHPNIVTIHDVSEFQGRPYFVMEHIEGQSLHHFAHDEPLPMDMIIEYAIQICQGLAEAHRAGIVHRDIKATNIAIDKKGRVRLLDFGLAAIKGDDKITKTGTTLGTVSYMSPEQVSGREIDHRSDLFSFGIVLYELIAGRTPFRRESEGATLKAIVEDLPEPLARYKSDVPERLQAIVSKLLEKDKEIRYQSAEGIIADLKRLLYDSQPTYYRSAPKPKKRRSRLITGIAAASMLGVIAAIIILFGFSSVKETQAEGVPRIAVLPFENLGSAGDEYFADGMTEEITSRLAGIQGLGVISRTSANKYKNSDKSLSDIGHELGVEYILEGSVRWSKVDGKQRVRITPQLIRVSDDRHLWADNYERDLMQVFEVQADISMQIVDQLGLTLLDKSKENLERKLTDDPEAYAYYLKAVSEIKDPGFAQEQTRKTIALLDSAITLDPSFAMAYAYRSIAQSWYVFGALDALAGESDQGQVSLDNAQKALQLEPGLPQGFLALGMYYNLVKRNYDRALDEFSRAQAGMPNNAELLDAIALVHWRQGNFSEAQNNFRKAIELDPLTSSNHWELANCLSFTRNYDEALKAINRAILLQPDRPDYYAAKLDILLGWHGDLDELRNVIMDASKHVEPVEIVARGYWQFNLADISLDSVLSYFQSKRDSTQSDLEYYSTVAMTYMSAKQEAFMQDYCDSIRLILEDKVQEVPDEYGFHEGLGLAYACLGDYDAAIQEGETAMELMSVDDCHW